MSQLLLLHHVTGSNYGESTNTILKEGANAFNSLFKLIFLVSKDDHETNDSQGVGNNDEGRKCDELSIQGISKICLFKLIVGEYKADQLQQLVFTSFFNIYVLFVVSGIV